MSENEERYIRAALVGGLLLVVAVAFGIALWVSPARGHEAVTGWQYPPHCCGDRDCGHALAAKRNADGSLTVTTEHGTATFPANFKHEDSPDGLIHACFVGPTLYCLFLSSGS